MQTDFSSNKLLCEDFRFGVFVWEFACEEGRVRSRKRRERGCGVVLEAWRGRRREEERD